MQFLRFNALDKDMINRYIRQQCYNQLKSNMVLPPRLELNTLSK